MLLIPESCLRPFRDRSLAAAGPVGADIGLLSAPGAIGKLVGDGR